MTRARDVANLIGSGNYSSTTFTATAGQTAFTISHTQGFVQVFMNGLLLDETVDYTSNGTAITLTSGAAAGDEIEVVAYNTFSVGDAQTQAQADARYYTQSAADTRYVNATGDSVTGELLVRRARSNTAGDAALTIHPSDTTVSYGLRIDQNTNSLNFDQVNNNTTKMSINSLGHVTMPYQPAFDVAQPAQVSGDHTFNQIHLNRGSHYNNSNGRFTAPVAGVYVFNFGGIKNGNSTTTVRLYLKKNGTRLHSQRHLRLDGGQVNTYGDNGSVQWIAELAVNDYIQAETGNGTVYNATGEYTTFSGFLVG